LVRAPPKRVVDDCGASEGGILQKGAIERHILGNAINDHVVAAWLALNHFVDPDRFCDDIFAAGLLINAIDERPGKGVFLAKQDSDFFHKVTVKTSTNNMAACRASTSTRARTISGHPANCG